MRVPLPPTGAHVGYGKIVPVKPQILRRWIEDDPQREPVAEVLQAAGVDIIISIRRRTTAAGD